MFEFRREQIAQMRREKISDALMETFAGSPLRASRDEQTKDILATDAHGQATRFSFDERGLIGGVTTPMGRTWRLANYPDGKAQVITNPAGHMLGLTYVDSGHVESIASDGRSRFRFQYNERQNVTRIEFGDGTSSSIDYQPSGLVSSNTDRRGVRESFEHDLQGRLTSFADGNGNQTVFSYSVWDRPDATTFPDGSSESYSYTAEGLLGQIRSGDASVEIEHDDQGRPVQLTYSDGRTVQYTYDSNGRVLGASTGEHASTFTWNENGRLTSEGSGDARISYHYDAAGRLSGITYPTGETVAFGWDADARLSSVKDWNGSEHRLRYAPSDRGWGLISPSGLETLTALNSKGLAESILVTSGPGAPVLALGFEYDPEDRVSSFNDSAFGTCRYRYDADGQLIAVEGSNGRGSERFEYDGAGNLTLMPGTEMRVNQLNQLTLAGNTSYEYDPCGNVMAIRGVGENWRFTYDARDLLVRAESSKGVVATYEYDAFRRRVGKRLGDVVVTYVWAGEQLISEIWRSGERSTRQDYIYYPGTPMPLAMRVALTVYCYHNDHLGRPRALSGPGGLIEWSADYSAFGEARVQAAGVPNPLRAPGQYFDEETGLHYNRFRYYSPTAGRYLSRDPASYLAGLNLYQYCSNNPVNQADPLGLWSWKSVVSVVAAVAVGVAVVALAPLALPAAIIVAGAAAGAVGFGLNEGLNEKEFSLLCILKEAARGALIGAVAAIPFAILPATAGVLAFAGAGALSGAISYTGNWATSDTPWSWQDFALSVGIGAVTAGAGRFIGGRFAQWKAQRAIVRSQAAKIAGGHAFDKHVVQNGEFPGITTSEQFSTHIENIMNNPSDVKILSNGRVAYWDDASNTVVIRNPSSADGGTAFKPTQGKNYFNNLK